LHRTASRASPFSRQVHQQLPGQRAIGFVPGGAGVAAVERAAVKTAGRKVQTLHCVFWKAVRERALLS
jgi:hypothetical protein